MFHRKSVGHQPRYLAQEPQPSSAHTTYWMIYFQIHTITGMTFEVPSAQSTCPQRHTYTTLSLDHPHLFHRRVPMTQVSPLIIGNVGTTYIMRRPANCFIVSPTCRLMKIHRTYDMQSYLLW